MTRYILRLDDASPRLNVDNWRRITQLLNRYRITPLVGVIPDNQDPSFAQYPYQCDFWTTVQEWIEKGWDIALHGHTHVCSSSNPGINPVHDRSEFAGLSLPEQQAKLSRGLAILKQHGVTPIAFFAPAHTFDLNSLAALKSATDIRIVSDTIASDIYVLDDLYFVPQQSGKVRRLPFKVATFCYHPNTMSEQDFLRLEEFLQQYSSRFTAVSELELRARPLSVYDSFLRFLYFLLRRLRKGGS